MKIKNGVVSSQWVVCPVCHADNCTTTGFDSDGRMLTIRFFCPCGVTFVYEYVRHSTETLFVVKVVQVESRPMG